MMKMPSAAWWRMMSWEGRLRRWRCIRKMMVIGVTSHRWQATQRRRSPRRNLLRRHVECLWSLRKPRSRWWRWPTLKLSARRWMVWQCGSFKTFVISGAWSILEPRLRSLGGCTPFTWEFQCTKPVARSSLWCWKRRSQRLKQWKARWRRPERRVVRQPRVQEFQFQKKEVVPFGSMARAVLVSPRSPSLGYFEVTLFEEIMSRRTLSGCTLTMIPRRSRSRRCHSLHFSALLSTLVRFYLVCLVEFAANLLWSVRTGPRAIFSLVARCLDAQDAASPLTMRRDLVRQGRWPLWPNESGCSSDDLRFDRKATCAFMVEPEEPHENSGNEPNAPEVSWCKNSAIDFGKSDRALGEQASKVSQPHQWSSFGKSLAFAFWIRLAHLACTVVSGDWPMLDTFHHTLLVMRLHSRRRFTLPMDLQQIAKLLCFAFPSSWATVEVKFFQLRFQQGTHLCCSPSVLWRLWTWFWGWERKRLMSRPWDWLCQWWLPKQTMWPWTSWVNMVNRLRSLSLAIHHFVSQRRTTFTSTYAIREIWFHEGDSLWS